GPSRPLGRPQEVNLALAFSPDGRSLASAGDADHVTIWDAATGQEVRRLRTSGAGLYGLALSPDGSRLVAADGGSGDGEHKEIKLWELDDGREILTLRITAAALDGLAFSPDGRTVVVHDHARVMLWTSPTP